MFRFSALLVLTALSFAHGSDGQQSSSTNGKGNQREPNQQTTKAKGSPCPPPLVCAPVSGVEGQQPATAENTATEKEPHGIWHKGFAPESWPSWALVFLAAVAAYVGLRTLRALLVQTRANVRSADAATETVRTMTDTAERQLRAYVLPTTAQRYRATQEHPSQVKVKFKNFGATPAFECTNWMGVDTLPWPLPAGITLQEPPRREQHRSVYLLGPGQEIELGGEVVSGDPAPVTPEQEEQIRRGQYALVVYGEIHYRDSFNVHRVTRFRFFSIGELIRTGLFSPHDEGNEAT